MARAQLWFVLTLALLGSIVGASEAERYRRHHRHHHHRHHRHISRSYIEAEVGSIVFNPETDFGIGDVGSSGTRLLLYKVQDGKVTPAFACADGVPASNLDAVVNEQVTKKPVEEAKKRLTAVYDACIKTLTEKNGYKEADAQNLLKSLTFYFEATAGLRLAENSQSSAFWDKIKEADAQLRGADKMIAKTIAGNFEGLYGYFAGVQALAQYKADPAVASEKLPEPKRFVYVEVGGASQQLVFSLTEKAATAVTGSNSDISHIWAPANVVQQSSPVTPTSAQRPKNLPKNVVAAEKIAGQRRVKKGFIEESFDGDETNFVETEAHVAGPVAVRFDNEGPHKPVIYSKSWLGNGMNRLFSSVVAAVVEKAKKKDKWNSEKLQLAYVTNPCMQANVHIVRPEKVDGKLQCIVWANLKDDVDPKNPMKTYKFGDSKICEDLQQLLSPKDLELLSPAHELVGSASAPYSLLQKGKGKSPAKPVSSIRGSPNYFACKKMLNKFLYKNADEGAVSRSYKSQFNVARNMLASTRHVHILFNGNNAGTALHKIATLYSKTLQIHQVKVSADGPVLSTPVDRKTLHIASKLACSPFNFAENGFQGFLCLSVITAEQTIFSENLLDAAPQTKVVFAAFSNPKPMGISWTQGAAVFHSAVKSAFKGVADAQARNEKINNCESVSYHFRTKGLANKAAESTDSEDRLYDMAAKCPEVTFPLKDVLNTK